MTFRAGKVRTIGIANAIAERKITKKRAIKKRSKEQKRFYNRETNSEAFCAI